MDSPAEPPNVSQAPDSDPHHTALPDGTVEGHALGSHSLGAHVVGQRVVVRRILPGQSGPTGGPAFTDTLGECLAWGGGRCDLRTEDGAVVSIAIAEIVSGKPVPPRASVRLRVPPRELHVRASGLLTGTVETPLGDWILRSGGTTSSGRAARRGNSVLAMGDPGVPWPLASTTVIEHYRALDLQPLALVQEDSDAEAALLALGWQDAGGRSEAYVAPLSRVQRALPPPPDAGDTDGINDHLERSYIDDEAHVLSAFHPAPDDLWVCWGELWVVPYHRGTGLSRDVLSEAADFAAAMGATTVHLQVEVENVIALKLYRSLGFTAHHSYRYLAHV